ncbi:rho GTPase-activating protein 12-like isoform X2 [Gigantopelta aegis]|uniref:rho GTPase-activating protein 12-like isoform X2 n=1 Tax=Gigantopelta aegis TaxID=1735272 RepID=UPI001B88DC77|nr:rho GTPase-activating protein 12-like isoform X2 [Gigantopelta aegis]
MSLSSEKSVVVVLFDYTYENDTGSVRIKTGDEYVLLDKTNDEWWHVKRQGDDESFYVPAQYVRLYDEEDSDISAPCTPYRLKSEERDIFDDDVNTPKDEDEGTPHPDYAENNNNVSPTTPEKPKLLQDVCSDPGPDYVNLDEFRSASNIKSPHGEIIYANVQCSKSESNDPPSPEDGIFVRKLVPYMPWDIYKEKITGRLFYHNQETDELMWKPPRKDKPTSGGNREQVLKSSPTTPEISVTFPPDSPPPVTMPSAYEETVEDGGKVVYIHRKTSQKWYSNLDANGHRYFYTDDNDESFWELPTMEQHNGEVSSQPGFAKNRRNVERMLKAKSMYEGLDQRPNSSAIPQIRSSTLPPSFIYPADEANVSATGGAPLQQSESSAQDQPFHFEDHLCGYLNKAKIADLGRKVNTFIRRSQRREVKSWSSSYVVLQDTNLVFYKDQKMAAQKARAPHGKPEMVVSIQGAKVEFNPSKDLTSRKNVIMMTSSSGSQVLLQSDDEKLIHQWLLRLKLLTDSKDGNKSPRASKIPLCTRSASESDVFNPQSPPNSYFWGIRTKLLNLISRRPTQEDLVRRGIIKHTVFGTNLRELCDREHCTVPKFVKMCVAAIENRGLNHDGLYRISGNQAEIQRLRFIVDKDEPYNLDDDQWDINVLTGSLKLFFRELCEPLFPQVLFDRFKEAICKDKNIDRLRAFKDLVAELPRCNYDTIKFIIHHLRKVIDKSHENRMQTQNVAIVFGPTLMWTEGDAVNMAVQSIYQGKVIEYVLLEYDQLFR